MRDIFGRGIPDRLSHSFTRAVLAESLWEYGEDALAEAALGLSESELLEVQILDVWHHTNDPEPTAGPQLHHGRIMCRAMIEFAESRPRDTKRQRRRTRPQSEGYNAAFQAWVERTGPEPDRTRFERDGLFAKPPRLPRRRLYPGSYDEVVGSPHAPEVVGRWRRGR